MKNSLALTLLLAGVAFGARPALAQIVAFPKSPLGSPNGAGTVLQTMPEIPAVQHFFDTIRETTVAGGATMDVQLYLTVSENAPVTDNQVSGGHCFTAYSEVAAFKRGAQGNASFLSMATAPIGVSYLFSDRTDNSYHNGGAFPVKQPFQVDKTERGTIRFQYSDEKQGRVSNVNLLTGWKGWTIKTATQASGTLLYGTLENGDVFTMSYRLSQTYTGR